MGESQLDEFDLEQMAEKMGIAPQTLKNRCHNKRKQHPPFYQPAKGQYRFPVTDYINWRRTQIIKENAA